MLNPRQTPLEKGTTPARMPQSQASWLSSPLSLHRDDGGLQGDKGTPVIIRRLRLLCNGGLVGNEKGVLARVLPPLSLPLFLWSGGGRGEGEYLRHTVVIAPKEKKNGEGRGERRG